jgi:beta-galactosidase
MLNAEEPFVPVQPQVSASRPDWENPEVFAIGKEAARATGFPFESRAKAIAGHRTHSDRFLWLIGSWRFQLSPDTQHIPKGFEQPGFDVSKWAEIEVPADWQAAGYDEPKGSDTGSPFPLNRPLVPRGSNPVGSYRRDAIVPAQWIGSDIILEIGAAGSAYYVWVNGYKAGYSEDSKLPSDFNISRFIRPGRNVIAIQVYRWSDGSYLEDRNSSRVSGIEREVFLMAAPKTRVRDFFAHAGLDPSYRDGTLSVDTVITPSSGPTEVRAVLLDGERPVLQLARTVPAGATERAVTLKGTVPGVKPWTAETPNLYMLLVELYDRKGAIIQSTWSRIGFRTVGIRDGLITVNGRPITIRGVDREEDDAVNLHAVSLESMERDIQMMKRANINALRTSGYPNDPRLYELADKYGLYVMDEANIDSRRYMALGKRYPELRRRYQLGFDPAWQAAQTTRVMNMVERDKNHPSIILWSLGNEAGIGPVFSRAAAMVKRRDPSRLVSYFGWGVLPEASAPRPNAYADIYAPMDASIAQMTDYATNRSFRKPMIEGAYMAGKSGGDLKDYWDAIYAHPDKLQGGFLWEWADQAGAMDTGAGVYRADRTPKPWLSRLAEVYSPIQFSGFDSRSGLLTVTNRYDFQNLSGYDFSYELLKDGVIVAKGDLPPMRTPAHSSARIRIPIESFRLEPSSSYVVAVFARAKAGAIPAVDPGSIIGSEQFILGGAAKPASAETLQ